MLFLCIQFNHPSVILTAFPFKCLGGAGAHPSCHWVRDIVHPEQVASLSHTVFNLHKLGGSCGLVAAAHSE